ncbi:hypothetical protein J7E25_05500 [Agromyces sp. ISL-38]|uniref:hypothetical protein n=1 Tax=Agromyces sp. ISL-38 TaxID=2819107 RepID=UPI001BE7FF06|nr:hypothetical protein [Agromyces sp. ISL-38]MBT2498544.1 hypothetical protein [Agromyces sp. ISL-38]
MDEDEFEKDHHTMSSRPVADLEEAPESAGRHPEVNPAFARSQLTTDPQQPHGLDLNGPAQRPGIVWVRASDLLNTSSGRVAGRGLDFEAELLTRMRRAPAATRRAIRERASKLPPLSEFGRSPEHTQFSRPGLGRR